MPKRWITSHQYAALLDLVIRTYGTDCALCGGEIDLKVKAPAPMSVSIDHVVPRSLGGSNHLGNLRPAHRLCNMRKGNRPLKTKKGKPPATIRRAFPGVTK